MRSHAGLIQAVRFRLDETRTHLRRIEKSIAEFEAIAAELDAQIRVEEERAGISDPDYFAYPTFARAARRRRENVVASIASLKAELGRARLVLSAAEEEAARAGERIRPESPPALESPADASDESPPRGP